MSRDTDQALRDIVKGASIVYTGLVLEIAIAFLAQWLAAKHLSISGFGGVTTGLAVLNVGAIVGSLGFGSGLTRYLPRLNDEGGTALVRSSLLLAAPAGLVIGGLVTLNAGFVASVVFGDPTVAPSLRVFGAAIPAATVLTVAVGAIRGAKQSTYRVYVENVVRPITRFGLVILAVVLGLGQFGFATAYGIPYIVGAVVAIALAFRSFGAPALGAVSDRELLGDVTRYSLPFVFSDAASFIYRSADIFLILYFLDSGSVGIYGVAYAVARLLLMFSTAFDFLGTPVASELEAGKGIGEAISVHRSMLRWLVILSIPALVPFLFFPGTFVAEVYRPRYAAGGTALAILAAGFTVHNVLGPNVGLLEAMGHSQLIAINTVAAAVTNVVLNVVLIPGITLPGGFVVPALGIEGAAIATVTAYLLRDVLTVGELWVITDAFITSRKVLAPVVVAAPLLAGLAAIAPVIPGTLLWIVAVSAGFGLAYLLAVVLTLGFEEEEVMLVKSVEEKYGLSLGPVTTVVERFS